MGKQSSKALKPHQIEALARQQNFMSNPNVNNRFGSTTIEFDGNDQAQITQELSPEMNRLVDMQMDFLGGGPAQLGQFQSPFLQAMMQNTAGQLARTGGWNNVPQSSMMGGYSQPAYQGNEINLDGQLPADMVPTPTTPTPANPGLSFGLGQTPPVRHPVAESPNLMAEALKNYGSGGGQNPFVALGQGVGKQLDKKFDLSWMKGA